MGSRGCGYRQPGGVYLRTILSSRGSPLENFLFDPPIPAPEEMMIPTRGVSIIERPGDPGIYDVYDKIGVASYPNVADFYQELRKLGLSRRIKRDSRLELLDARSRIFLIHPRAIITNCGDYYAALSIEQGEYTNAHTWRCLKNIDDHDENVESEEKEHPEMCVSLWWDDIVKGEDSLDPDMPPRTVDRNIGNIWYGGRKRPAKVKPEYQEGIFMWLPLHRLDVIYDAEQDEHEKSLEQARRSGLPVKLEES
jgi:hypothetical protein